MNIETVLSSKGQMIIPKKIRDLMGLNTGSKLILKLEDNHLHIIPIKKDVSSFFAMGKKDNNTIMTVEDIDMAIEEAVTNNDKY